jgi:hypothetical protein
VVKKTYCIDTSALIAAWYERYKPNRFPKLWEQLDQLIQEGRLVSSTLVLRECSKQRSEELHDWLQPRASMLNSSSSGSLRQTFIGAVFGHLDTNQFGTDHD